MSAAPAAAQTEGEAPKKGKKKLILIVVGVLLVLLLAGGVTAYLLMKKSMASDAEGADAGDEHAEQTEDPKAQSKAKMEAATPPIFVPLDPFIVNLADRETERFAQIGINLQVDDAKVGEDMKLYMPAIRNAILLILSHKTAEELLTAEGKIKLAGEIQRGAARAMGYEIAEPAPEETVEPSADGETEAPAPQKKRKKKKAESYNPIVQVHYANFIIQ
ncbi:MAG: flagellar basal body-associated FliL family protein [Aquabacterium sp.]|jgi:flagellar FliL protein|uniref:flagellar basal body-associated FliL family protein n=1 Tax=Aquabacterium sp. TaxID=1872578 RepID=UPI001B62F248|nr:flagellar basal body-associated FliL family protein [Aquabacterium sp.]MBP7132116.1 flagellar basal body-associated FliL family protein [Aquabacterium sp.]MBP9062431.1 flagellar basal body-associated FliL family protein [Aquabacterium sp.]MDQ5927439.1 flagellar protein FliL [Pseudomonadota bacterium]